MAKILGRFRLLLRRRGNSGHFCCLVAIIQRGEIPFRVNPELLLKYIKILYGIMFIFYKLKLLTLIMASPITPFVAIRAFAGVQLEELDINRSPVQTVFQG